LRRYLECLSKPISQQSPILLEGFWPTNNWKVNHVKFCIPSVPIFDDMEDSTIPPYCGPKNMKPSLRITTYIPFEDLHEGDFLFTRPFELEMYPVWMAKVYTGVVKDVNDEHYRMVHVYWWVPFKKKTHNDAELYKGCWEGKWMQFLKPNAMGGHSFY